MLIYYAIVEHNFNTNADDVENKENASFDQESRKELKDRLQLVE